MVGSYTDGINSLVANILVVIHSLCDNCTDAISNAIHSESIGGSFVADNSGGNM